VTSDNPYKAFDRPDPCILMAVRSIGGTVYVTITTYVVSSIEVAVIRDAIHDLLETPPDGAIRVLIVDIEQVKIINSEAIGMFVATHSSAVNQGARLILSNVTDQVMEVLEATKITKLLTVCQTAEQLDDALRGDS